MQENCNRMAINPKQMVKMSNTWKMWNEEENAGIITTSESLEMETSRGNYTFSFLLVRKIPLDHSVMV